jgi:hypothetical protein
MLGVKLVPIEFGVDEKRRSLRIKDLLQLQIEGTADADSNQESLNIPIHANEWSIYAISNKV